MCISWCVLIKFSHPKFVHTHKDRREKERGSGEGRLGP